MATAFAGSHESGDGRTWHIIFRIALAISSRLDLKQIIEMACRALVELCGADHSAVLLVDDSGSQGTIKGEYGDGLRAVGSVVPLANSPAEADLFRDGTPIVAEDVALTTGLGPVRDLLLEHNIRSFIAVPIRSKRTVLGSISLDVFGKKKLFSQQDMEACQEVAATLAIAVELEVLTAQAQDQQSQILHMQRTISDINSSQTTEELLEAMVQNAVRLLRSRDAGVYLYLSQKRKLCLSRVLKSPEVRMHQMLSPGQGMAGRLFETKAPFLMTPDYRKWLGKWAGYDGAPFEAVLEVPIQDRDKTIGVLFVESPAGRRYTPAEIWTLRWVADQAAVVLHNTELKRRLHLLLNATRLLAEQHDINEGLKDLAQTIVGSLEASFCRILLMDDTGNELLPKAHVAIERSAGVAPARMDPLPIDDWAELRCFLNSGVPHLLSYSEEHAKPALEAISQSIRLATPVQSLLLVPLKLGGRIVGLIEVGEMRQEARQPITEERQDLILAVANHVAVIAGRERLARLKNDFAHFSELLDGQKEQLPLFQATLRFVTLLFPGTRGAMFIRDIARETLVSILAEGLSLRSELQISADDPVIGAAMRRAELVSVTSTENWKAGHELFGHFTQGTVVAVPLQITGQVEAVVVIHDPRGQWLRPDIEPEGINILERFVKRASTALATSRMITANPRLAAQLMRLHPVIDYMLKAPNLKKLLHIFLTGVTAGYALGFNRAAVFLIDPKGEYLEGHMAIGDSESWDQNRVQTNDFASFTKELEADKLPASPFDAQICQLRIPLRHGEELADAFRERKWTTLKAVPSDKLDPEFARVFAPRDEFRIGPLIGSQAIGVLVVDNKFTNDKISELQETLLLGFAHRAAVTIQNRLAFDEVLFAQERLRRLHAERTKALQVLFDAAHRQPSDEQGYGELLTSVVEAASRQFDAPIVTLWPFDQASRQFVPQDLVGHGLSAEILEDFRNHAPGQHQLTHTALQCEYLKVEDMETVEEQFLSISTKALTAKAGIASFQAVSLAVEKDPIAVLYVSYAHARSFNQEDEKNLRTFAVGVSQTLRNARLHLEVLKARQAAQALAEMVKELNSEDPTTIFEFIGQKAQDLLRCDIVSLFTYDQIADRLSGPYILRSSDSETGLGHGASFPSLGWIHDLLNMEDERIVGRVDEDPEFSSKQFAQAEGIKTLMVVPLRTADCKVGLMFINYCHYHYFTQSERDNVSLVADLVSVAIRNAQLFAERRSEEEFAKKLLDCWSANEIAHAASEHARTMLGVEFGGVALEECA